MGIDSIGKIGGFGAVAPTAPSSIDGAIGSTGAENVHGPDTFSVSGTSNVEHTMEASPIDRLRTGEVDVNGYLDMHVDRATAHLAQHIDSEQLEFIRSSLRSHLEQDPAFADLLRCTTGSVQSAAHRG